MSKKDPKIRKAKNYIRNKKKKVYPKEEMSLYGLNMNCTNNVAFGTSALSKNYEGNRGVPFGDMRPKENKLNFTTITPISEEEEKKKPGLIIHPVYLIKNMEEEKRFRESNVLLKKQPISCFEWFKKRLMKFIFGIDL